MAAANTARSTALIAHAGEIEGKAGENLRAALGQLPLARALATIKCDVAARTRPRTALQPVAPDGERLRELYHRLEFKTWLAELGGVNAPPVSAARPPAAGQARRPACYATIFDHGRARRAGSRASNRRSCTRSTPRPPASTR
ncbi:MAG: hypothetical protein MZV65_21510 [Chromatiales bacterium]|nr:hypothetical protein [Chromatiales bacterium]